MPITLLPDIWRPVIEFPGYYASWNGGIVGKKGRPLKPYRQPGKYAHLVLLRDGREYTRYVHSLVTSAFLGPCPQGLEVLHANGDSSDNRLVNLSYGTHIQNVHQCIAHGNMHTRDTLTWYRVKPGHYRAKKWNEGRMEHDVLDVRAITCRRWDLIVNGDFVASRLRKFQVQELAEERADD